MKHTKPCFGMPFMAFGQETERALFLQPQGPYGAQWKQAQLFPMQLESNSSTSTST